MFSREWIFTFAELGLSDQTYQVPTSTFPEVNQIVLINYFLYKKILNFEKRNNFFLKLGSKLGKDYFGRDLNL